MSRKAVDLQRLSRIKPADIESLKSAKIKDLALAQLKHFIVSASVQPGQRLPPERELAEKLGVGRNSIREALKVLEAVGLIESRVGDGTFITAQTGASIGRTIGLSLALWGGTIVEILDARRMIEVEAARAAAQQIDEQELAALEAELLKMEKVEATVEQYLAADMNFHRIVARATHNAIISHIMQNLIDLLEEVLQEVRADQIPLRAEGTGTHREVYEAIINHDSAQAGDAMRRHLDFSAELWQAVVSLGAAKAPQD